MRFHDKIFSQHMRCRLNGLRGNKTLSDVTIVVDGREFKAHKAILSSVSPYFRAMFNSEGSFKECKQEKITLHGVDCDAVSAILKFIYTSRIEINDKNIYPLIESSNLLLIDALKAWIVHYLYFTMTIDNCLSIFCISSLYGYYDLSRIAFKYILLNFSKVAEGDEFLHLPFKSLTEIVSSKLLNVVDESSLLKHILKWIQADAKNREKHVEELLINVELTNIPRKSLIRLKNDLLVGASEHNKIETFLCDHLNRKCEMKEDSYSMKAEKLETVRYQAEQGVILAIGGESNGMALRSVECFTQGYDSWKYVIPQHVLRMNGPQNTTVIPTMTCARYNAAVAYDAYNVYVLGGRNSSSCLDECETYNVKNNRWKHLDKLPCKLEGNGAVLLEGRLVTVGGRNEFGCVKQAWEWNEKHSAWKDFPSLNSPRCFHGTVAVSGYIFALGGFDGNKGVALNTVERYDPSLKKWSEIRSMSDARANFGCAVVDNYIFVIGGIDGIDGKLGLRSVERYDLQTNDWSYMLPMSVPRYSFSVAVSEKNIYCIGGGDTIHHLNNVVKFNPYTNRWHHVLSMQISRFGLVSATVLVPLIKRN